MRVARLVVGDDLALLAAHDPLLLEAGDQPVDGVVEVLHRRPPYWSRRAASSAASLTRLARSAPANPAVRAATVRRSTSGPRVTFRAWMMQHLLAAVDVGLVDQHLAIEAAGAQQRRIEHLGPVGGGHDDDGLAGVEAVHLGQQLVERLLALLVAADRALRPHLAQRVELVDEDDARRLGLGLREQIAHAGRADADEHLHELRAAQAEERHLGLAGDGPGQQRLAGARRADQQHALGNAAAQRGVLLRILQELDDLAQLLLGFVDAGDVLEGDLDVILGVDLGLAAGEGHDAALAAHPPHQERPQRHEQQDRA